MTNLSPLSQTPPYVYHMHMRSTDDRRLLIERCIKAFAMRSAEAQLLRVYGLCTNGFQPSAEYIQQQTAMSRRSVFHSRSLLAEDGLIAVTDSSVIVDWNRIRLFASGLIPIAKQRRRRYIAPVSFRTKKLLTSSELMSIPMQAACNYMASLSERDYAHMRKSIEKEL